MESDIPKIISDARGCGATGIKLYAHLSADLIRKLSDEAKKQGLKVWAHMVPYPATAEEVAGAGVEEHLHFHKGNFLVSVQSLSVSSSL